MHHRERTVPRNNEELKTFRQKALPKAEIIVCCAGQVPWDDLRYLFGEIMYGGHIIDDWDRKLCKTYLEEYVGPEMLEGELCLAPGFPVPPNSDYKVSSPLTYKALCTLESTTQKKIYI